MTRNGFKLFVFFSKSGASSCKSSVAILKESKSSWQFSRVEIMPGKHSVSSLVKQVINTGIAGKRVGYREPIKNIDYELHASRVSNTPFDSLLLVSAKSDK